MRTIALVLVLAATSIGQQKAPRLPILEKEAYGTHDLVASVNAVIALGEKEGVKFLLSKVTHFGAGKGFCINERVAWICRLVFEPKSPTKDEKPRKVMSPGGPVLVGGAKVATLATGPGGSFNVSYVPTAGANKPLDATAIAVLNRMAG